MKTTEIRLVGRCLDTLREFIEAVASGEAGEQIRREIHELEDAHGGTERLKQAETILEEAKASGDEMVARARAEADEIITDAKNVELFAQINNDIGQIRQRLDQVMTQTTKAEEEHATIVEGHESEIRELEQRAANARRDAKTAEQESTNAIEAAQARATAAEEAHEARVAELTEERRTAEQALAKAKADYRAFIRGVSLGEPLLEDESETTEETI